MNAILGFSQLLSTDSNLNSDQKNTLSIINRSGEHLMALINDVLEMSKIEAGKLELNRSVFSPEKLVRSLTEMFEVRTESKGLNLIIEMPDDLPELVESDESKLRQVITNLLGNALKFTTHGTIKLKGWYFSGKNSSLDPVLVFRVSDTGVGISREDQQKLFTPFVQTESGITAQEGTGLGLTISKAFVELLGGQIKLESELGKGTAFSFWLPCRKIVEEESFNENIPTKRYEIGQMQQATDSHKPTILVVDDQPENRLLAVRFLKSIGFTVREAVDGQDAIDVFRESLPAAILMDLRMPGTDGLTATRAIRAMKDIPFQPLIIALTGNAFEEDRKKAFAAGCDEFLAKPFRLDDLLGKLTRHLPVEIPCSN